MSTRRSLISTDKLSLRSYYPRIERAPVPAPKSKQFTYADAGVDITRGDQAKERIKTLAQQTFTRSVLGGIGGFGALFAPDLKRYKNPVLVSSADGVGTKLKIAF